MPILDDVIDLIDDRLQRSFHNTSGYLGAIAEEIAEKLLEKYDLKEKKRNMTKEEFENLEPGDLVRHVMSDQYSSTYVVTSNYGGSHIIAVKTVDISDPNEWELVLKRSIVE
jgi:hypothetical protein